VLLVFVYACSTDKRIQVSLRRHIVIACPLLALTLDQVHRRNFFFLLLLSDIIKSVIAGTKDTLRPAWLSDISREIGRDLHSSYAAGILKTFRRVSI